MSQPRAVLKVATIFVIFVTVASCTGAETGQQNKNNTKSWQVPQSGPVDKLPAIPVALPTETTTSETCPFLPAAVADKMFTKNHRMDAQVLSDSRNQKIECIAMHPKRGAGLIAKFEFTKSVRPVPVHFRSEPQPIKRPDKNPPADILKLTKRYPGVVFTKADWAVWWSCGAVEIKYFKYSDAPKPEGQGQPRSLWHDGVHVVESAIASLCGTIDKPSKHVTDWPHIVRDRYDAFGGTSPEKYGIPRPNETADTPYPGP